MSDVLQQNPEPRMVTVTTPVAVLYLLTLAVAALVGAVVTGVAATALTGHRRRRRAAGLSIPVYYRGLTGAR